MDLVARVKMRIYEWIQSPWTQTFPNFTDDQVVGSCVRLGIPLSLGRLVSHQKASCRRVATDSYETVKDWVSQSTGTNS